VTKHDPLPQDLHERAQSNGHAPNLSGAEILDELVGFIRRFVALSNVQVAMVALWVVHTHAIDAADCTPYLHLTSAEKRSGKTRLLEVLTPLVARPWFTGRVSAAVLVRKTANEQPSLLLDESDAAFQGDKYAEALRGILNAGFKRGGVTSLCVGQGANLSYRDFPVFSPKAIAGIGKLPDTIADRAVPIELRRRRQGEYVERFRQRKVEPDAVPLHSAAAAWVEANLGVLAEAEPELPDQLDDRAQDIVEPLLAIADAAGGEWPKRAREAAVALLTGGQRDAAESLGVRLLRDIHTVFKEKEAEQLRTTAILSELNHLDDAPWGSLRGQAMDGRSMARLLKPYGIGPQTLRERESTYKGYRQGDFEDAWQRYTPDTPALIGNTVTEGSNPADRAESAVTDSDIDGTGVTDKNEKNPHKQADVTDVSDTPGGREIANERYIQSECEVFEMAREYFGLNNADGAT
jgi:hypothetical protein